MMNIITWNCTGTGSKAFPLLLRDLAMDSFSSFVILVETRDNKEKVIKIIACSNFDASYRIESRSQAGGLWMMWKLEKWKIQTLNSSPFHVYIRVVYENDESWILTTVYGSPQSHNRCHIWNILNDQTSYVNDSWQIIGNFNSVFT